MNLFVKNIRLVRRHLAVFKFHYKINLTLQSIQECPNPLTYLKSGLIINSSSPRCDNFAETCNKFLREKSLSPYLTKKGVQCLIYLRRRTAIIITHSKIYFKIFHSLTLFLPFIYFLTLSNAFLLFTFLQIITKTLRKDSDQI